jgi:hypothetical protein
MEGGMTLAQAFFTLAAYLGFLGLVILWLRHLPATCSTCGTDKLGGGCPLCGL